MNSNQVYASLIGVFKDHDRKEGLLRVVKSCIEEHLRNPEGVDFERLLKMVKEELDNREDL